MTATVAASRVGPDIAPATGGAGRPDRVPPLAWERRGRTERRRPELTAFSGAAASPEGMLGPALVHALRQIVRGELEVRFTPPAAVQPSRWMTPPAACRLTRVPVKTIRAWVRDGRIPKRLKNRGANPKQQKYLVNVDDVIAIAERVSAAEAAASEPLNVQERAREILAARASKRR